MIDVNVPKFLTGIDVSTEYHDRLVEADTSRMTAVTIEKTRTDQSA